MVLILAHGLEYSTYNGCKVDDDVCLYLARVVGDRVGRQTGKHKRIVKIS